MRQQTLGNEEGVFGIVANHPSIDDETMAPRIPEQSLCPLWRDSLSRKTQRVSHGGAEEDAPKSILRGERLNRPGRRVHANSQRIRRQTP
jgi:hypothetical protein